MVEPTAFLRRFEAACNTVSPQDRFAEHSVDIISSRLAVCVVRRSITPVHSPKASMRLSMLQSPSITVSLDLFFLCFSCISLVFIDDCVNSLLPCLGLTPSCHTVPPGTVFVEITSTLWFVMLVVVNGSRSFYRHHLRFCCETK